MVELMLPTHGSTPEISIIPYVVDVEISLLLEPGALDGNNPLLDNVINHIWNRIIINNDPLGF